MPKDCVFSDFLEELKIAWLSTRSSTASLFPEYIAQFMTGPQSLDTAFAFAWCLRSTDMALTCPFAAAIAGVYRDNLPFRRPQVLA